MKKLFLSVAVLCVTLFVQAKDYADYVSPLVGTQSSFELSTGNTYPAISRPWGMNFWTPQTGKMGDGWQYVYTANKIRGFKQTHQPSPWINDYGQFSIMPVTGKPEFEEDKRASWFSHKAEIAKPYYYKVYLAEHDVVTEMVPTERAVMFRFTFPENDSYVVVDAFDRGSSIKVIPGENKIVGYTTRNSGGVPANFKNYFVIEFDKPFTYEATFSNDVQPEKPDGSVPVTLKEGKLEQTDFHTGAVIGFKTKKGEVVHARVASSFISPEQAIQNLKELGGDSFEVLVQKGKDAWNEVLGKVEVEGGTLDQYRTFYSCLYRSLLFPRKFYELDANGQPVHYSPYNGETLPGYMYTDTGFWDTFRCLFPFLNLMYPSVNQEIQEGLINTYKESGFFPEWASPGHRGCMIGNNSVSLLVDAWMKGIQTVDAEKALEAMIHQTQARHAEIASVGRDGFEYYDKLGYVPYPEVPEATAKTLEYAYADWCIARFAESLGKQDIADQYYQKAQNYRNLYYPEHGFMWTKDAKGNWRDRFDATEWGGPFTEGSSWHWTWSVFHDPEGLSELMGGHEPMIARLDSMFVAPNTYNYGTYGFVIHEIAEMVALNMGQYAHGNQPVQHAIYLYDYIGQPWKTQYHLRNVMDKLYNSGSKGYCGDEDNGQTSAWYVFSAMGFYPVCPGMPEYAVGSPLFKKVTLHLPEGKNFVVSAADNAADRPYIRKALLNGQEFTRNYLTHDELKQGGELNLSMDSVPNQQRGTQPADFPYSYSK